MIYFKRKGVRHAYLLFAPLLVSLIPGCSSFHNQHPPQAFSAEARVLEKTLTLERDTKGIPIRYSLNYALLQWPSAPERYRFPLLLVLHGRGGSGPVYLNLWKTEAKKKHWMILAPSYENQKFTLEDIPLLLEEVIKHYPVDQSKIYIAGMSAGGFISQMLVVKDPAVWKAAVFIGAPAFPADAPELKDLEYPPFLFVHGKKDQQFLWEEVEKSVLSLKERGVRAETFYYSDAGHEQRLEWSKTILDWLESA